MKGSVLKKFLCTCLVTAAAFAATTISASACTTIYVGGDLVEEGTPFVARTEDYGSDYNKLWFISESGKWKQGDHYVGCPEYGPFEWDFTHDSYRFTYFTNDIYYDGICPECGEKADHYSYTEFGTNEKGVSVSATETLYGNEKVTEADPYRDAEWAEANKSERIGIEETDIPTIILAEASSAREGVKLLLDIYENYGCVAASGVFVCDKDEAWYVENCSGTQYVAIKLNDNMIFLEPNMAVIGRVDLDDENVIASKDLIAVAKKAGTFVGDEAKNIIDFRASYARISEKMDQRMIDGLNYLNATYKYDSDTLVADNTKFTISNLDASDKLVALYTNIKADRKLDKDDVFGYYKLSSIGKASNQEIEIFQLFKDRPVETATVGWVGVGNMSYNVFVPYYPMLIDSMYSGYQVSTASAEFTTNILVLIPLMVDLDVVVGSHRIAGEVEHLGDGQLDDRIGVEAGSVEHLNALRLGSFHIDMVEAHRADTDDLQILGSVEDLLVDRRIHTHDEHVILRDDLGKLRLSGQHFVIDLHKLSEFLSNGFMHRIND